jgi:hypothetical protein
MMGFSSHVCAFSPSTLRFKRVSLDVGPLMLSSQGGDGDFWAKQKQLAADMTESSEKSLRA